MCLPRKTLINLENTEYYHCISRCVRRAFLCGYDSDSKKNFDHRRQWFVDRLKLLTEHFTIGICAYAVMYNHCHLVLKVDSKQSLKLTKKEVIARWVAIYPSGLSQLKDYLDGTASKKQIKAAKRRIKLWRKRLKSISWFMRSLNHYIACKANKEDGCKGHFWESRFTSQALLDDTATLSCMAYVDLNPIRAGIADDLNDSDFTSIKERIQALKFAQQASDTDENGQNEDGSSMKSYQPDWLLAFGHSHCESNICFSLVNYLDMVYWTGREVRKDKKGYIASDVPEILKELNLDAEQWLKRSQQFEQLFAGIVAKREKLYFYANKIGQSHCKGVGV